MTQYTSPDNLPYPGPENDNDPADVPLALASLAATTQVALTKRDHYPVTWANLSYSSGWKAHTASWYGGIRFAKVGHHVTAEGMVMRSSKLTVADNTLYTVGTIPVGWRPLKMQRQAVPWSAVDVARGRQYMVTTVVIGTDGTVELQANVDGSMEVDADYVSFCGLKWTL